MFVDVLLDASCVAGHVYTPRIFGVLILVGIISAIFSGIVGAALGLALPPGGDVSIVNGQVRQAPVNTTNQIINQVVLQFVNILFGAYGAVCATLLYFDTRVRKEGFDLEVAARQQGEPAEPV